MRRFAALFATLLVTFGMLSVAFADTSVTARVEPETVEVGQPFDYTVEILTSGSEEITFETAPDFGDLQLVGRQQRSAFRPGSGLAARQIFVIFSLRASKTGTTEISPPDVKVGRKTFKLESRKVRVVPKGQAPKPKVKRDERFAIDASITPERDPYVGEQITLTYYLLRDARTPQVQAAPPNEPALDDFWIEDLTERNANQRRTVLIDGKHYERTSVRVYGLFPLKAGPAEIEPMTVDVQVGGFFQRPQAVTIESDAIKLDVQPLPPNAPPGFNESNVGQWEFSTRVDHGATKVGRPVTLELIVEGRGHIERIQLPELTEIPNARITHSEDDVRRHRGSNRLGGRKVTRITFLPTKEGTLEIPPLAFHFFDPDQGEYETVNSKPISVKVAPGVMPEETTQARAEARAATDEADAIGGLVDALLEPRSQPGDDAPTSPLGSWWFLLLAALPLLGMGALLAETPLKRRRANSKPRRARAAALERATESIEAAEQWDDLYAAVRSYLSTRFDVPSGRVTGDEIAQALVARGLSAELANEFEDWVRDVERTRFSGSSPSIGRGKRDHILQLLQRTDKASGAGPVSAIAVVLSVLIFAVPAFAQDTARTAWNDGNHAAAAKVWSEQADEAPRNVTAQFNAGTAHAKAESYGAARLYLERAAALAPLDGDVRDQLDIVRRIIRYRAIESSRSGKTLDGDEPLFWWRFAGVLWPPAVAGTILVGLWLAFAAMLIRRFRSETPVRDAAFVVLVIGLTAAALGVVAASVRAAALGSVRPAVLMVDDPQFLDGPSTHAKPLTVPASAISGTVVRVVEDRDDWVKVALPGELEGWTERDAIEEIAPR